MTAIRSGRYAGQTSTTDLSIRLEKANSGSIILSGDVNRQGQFIASFVSLGTSVNEETGTVEAPVRFRGNPELDTGSVRIDVDERGLGSFQLSVDLENGHRDFFAGELRWESSRFRKLHIEIDGLEGTLPPKHFQSSVGDQIDMRTAFEGVGFDVTIEEDPFSWKGGLESLQRGWTPAEMHMAMESLRRNPEPGAFQVHLFVASFMAGRDNRGVLGIMFDWGNDDLNGRPREGVTVFHDHPMLSDPRFPQAERDREYIFTAVHEVGHAMNLLHSFDKSRPASLSWMNYPQYYPFGHEKPTNHDGSPEFWNAFTHSFDAEELQHLRHATPREILPGGYSFGVYEEGVSTPLGGQTHPRRPAPGANPLRADRNIKLQLQPHRVSYELGEPVLVSIALENTGQDIAYVPNALDPTEGLVRVQIRSPNGQTMLYRPPMRLCKSPAYFPLRPNNTLQGPSSSPLFLSADGPVFTEPGTYRLRATLSGVNGCDIAVSGEVPLVIESPTKAVDQFATELWENSGALEAMYLRHPLVALEDWRELKDSVAKHGLDKRRQNSTASYTNYIGGVGWMTSVLDVGQRREMHEDISRAADEMQKADLKLLPDSAAQRVNEVIKADKSKKIALAGIQSGGMYPVRSSEAMRTAVPPSGWFGYAGLDQAQQTSAEPVNPSKRIVNALLGQPRFADIVSWNIEHLHDRRNWKSIDKIAELIRAMRCDFWALQEVDQDSLAELVKAINSSGTIRYDFDVVDGGGQQCGCLFRTDTVRLQRLPYPPDFFDEQIETLLRDNKKVKRKVFFRKPYLADVRVLHGDKLAYDFRCAVVHLKSTDNKLKDKGASIRERSAELASQWIQRQVEGGSERDYLVLGDLNAETAKQGLSEFLEDSALSLLSVGMQEKYGTHNALTRVASKRLLDHVVVSADTVALMPKEDLEEQIIIRTDRDISSFTSDYSDHIPVAVRFVIGEDHD